MHLFRSGETVKLSDLLDEAPVSLRAVNLSDCADRQSREPSKLPGCEDRLALLMFQMAKVTGPRKSAAGWSSSRRMAARLSW